MKQLPACIAIVLCATITMALTATAEARADDAVRCRVSVIHATSVDEDEARIDPALQPIADYLRRSFGARYNAFRELDKHSMTLAHDKKQTRSLPDGRSLGLTYKGRQGEFRLIFMELPHLKTTVKVRDGGLFFQAGQSFKGGILILAIHAG